MMQSTLRRDVIQHLKLVKNYSSVRFLGKGGFGDVLGALTEHNQQVAIKIIESKHIWRLEEEIWPLLDHENVLPVIEILAIDVLNVKLFVMPQHPTALDRMVDSAEFKSDPCGLRRIKWWLQDTLKGLVYLHGAGFCHLDIKSDNILISREDRAILCDFSGLNLTGVTVYRICSPYLYRPPECHVTEGIIGVSYDVWTYGLMVLNVLTGDWFTKNVPGDQPSWEVVKSVLGQSLEVLKKN